MQNKKDSRISLAKGTKLGRFMPKNQHTQRKLLSIKNWCSVKKCQNLTFKVIFFIEKYQFRKIFFIIDIFLIASVLESLYYQNDAQSLTAHHYNNSPNSIISFEYVDS